MDNLNPHTRGYRDSGLRPCRGRSLISSKDPHNAAEAALEAAASYGSQLNVALHPPPEEDILDLDYGEDDDVASNLLIFEHNDDIFVTSARDIQPVASIASRNNDGNSMPASPSLSSDILNVCKRANARLDVPWPITIAETTRSHYEGKRLPGNLFPWSLIPGASSFNCEAMESLGLLRMPPMEPLVAA